jgi:AcrR family transcriptional regulator
MLQSSKEKPLSRGEARRRHLLETARKLFVEKGFHQTGMAQIAEASGIKVGQIYRDFESKEAIIAAIAEADLTAWLEEDALRAAVEQGDAETIRAWIGRFDKSNKCFAECQMMTEVLAEASRNDRIAAIYRGNDCRVRTTLLAALAALSRRAADDPRLTLLAEFILAAGLSIAARRVVNPELPADQLRVFLGDVIDRELKALSSD